MGQSKIVFVGSMIIGLALVLGFQNCAQDPQKVSTGSDNNTTACTNPFGCAAASPTPTVGGSVTPTPTPLPVISIGSPCQFALATFDNPTYSTGPNFSLAKGQFVFMRALCPSNAANMIAKFSGSNGGAAITAPFGTFPSTAVLIFKGALPSGSYVRLVNVYDQSSNLISSMTSNALNLSVVAQSKTITWHMMNSVDPTTANLTPDPNALYQTFWQWNWYYTNVVVPQITGMNPASPTQNVPSNANTMSISDWCSWQVSQASPAGSGIDCNQTY